MRNFMMIAAMFLFVGGVLSTDADAAQQDPTGMSCMNGVCSPIPIVVAAPPCSVCVGEFIRPITTVDSCGRTCTKMVRVRRYALQGHSYIPCGQ